jgi:NADH-quinone oxidoreductase subunit K
MIYLNQYIVFSTLLFLIGLAGFLSRRNLFFMLMSLELMLNAVNVAFIAFAKHMGDLGGQMFVLFIIAIAAADAAVAFAIIISLYRLKGTTSVEAWRALKG